MKRLGWLVFIASCFVPLASAQSLDHIEAGVFADYFRIASTDTNQVGLGARLGFHIAPNTKLEAEMAYDFGKAFTEQFNPPPGGGEVGFQRTHLKILHGEIGPKFELGHGAFRPFLTVKGGFTNFSLDSRAASFDGFSSAVQGLRDDNMNPVLYPGGGVEAHAGPIGIRLDIGDEIYFNHGAHNNLRLAFGPFIRF